MFEWFYLFWRWLSDTVSSKEFWQPYLNMGNWFTAIVIILSTVYFLVVVRPWNWFRKEEEENP